MSVRMTGGAGGSGGSDECTATAAQVLSPSSGGGKAIVKGSDDEPIDGTLVLSGNATASYVLKDKTFYSSNDTKLTGTMTISSVV